MKSTLFNLVLLIFIPASLLSSDLRLGGNTLKCSLSKEWNTFKSDSTEGTKYIWFKRNHITDSKSVEVVPNLSIEIFNIIPEGSTTDESEDDLDMMIKTLLLSKAPPEVLREYKNSKDDSIRFEIGYKPSYGFLSNYTDDFGDIHDCYYITLMKEKEVGVFIIIDCTQEIFPHIEREVQDFLSSLAIK